MAEQPTLVEDLLNRKSKPFSTLDRAQANYTRDNMQALKKSAESVKSSNKAINDILLKRAALQERYEMARSRGDMRSVMATKKQLQLLDEQREHVENMFKLESEQLKLTKERESLQQKIKNAKFLETKQGQATLRQIDELNTKLIEVTSTYDQQLRVTRKMLDGVMDVKRAHELVNEEIEQEQKQLEFMSKTSMQKLGTIMADQFGAGFDRIKDDIKDKLLMFTKVGAGIGFGVAALRDLSKDSDEVVSTLYRMGGSLDRVNNKLGYYTSSVLELNRVQTSLRMTAAVMNMPVEAVEGMTEQIMHSIRVLDKHGKISFETVSQIGSDALNFARRTGMDVKETVDLVATMVNKYGQTAEASGETLDAIAASVVAANDAMEDIGLGKAGIFIEDVANMLKDAANNTEGFSLSLGKLGNIASNQMMIAKKFGATYNEALNQARMLTEFMTKRNPYANYRLGVSVAKDFMQDKDIQGFVAAKDVDGLTKFLGTKYGVSGNEANLVAKAVINKQGNWMETVGKFIGGTKYGQEKSASLLEEYASKAAANPMSEMTQRTMAAGLMGQDANSTEFMSMFNTWVEEARKRQKDGQPTTGFISAKNFEQMNQFKKAQSQSGYENTQKQSPITPVSLRETLDAVFQSPFTRLVIAAGAIVSAVSFTGLKTIVALTGIHKTLLGFVARGGVGGLDPSAMPGVTPTPTTGSWKDAARGARDKIKSAGVKGTLRAGAGKLGRFAVSNAGIITSIAGLAATSYLASKMSEGQAEEFDEQGNRKSYYQVESERLSAQVADYQSRVDEASSSNDIARRDYYQELLNSKKAELESISNQSSVYMEKMKELSENKSTLIRLRKEVKDASGLEKADKLAEIQRLESVNEGLEAFEKTGSLGYSSYDRMQDMMSQVGIKGLAMQGVKLAGSKLGAETLEKGALTHGAKVAGRLIESQGAKAALGMGAKAAGKTALKSGARAIPILGSLLSAGITAYMTEGSLGRKMFAAGGDLIGTTAGQVATGGIGGGIAGGLAGEDAGLTAYDKLFGGGASERARATLLKEHVVPAPTPTVDSSKSRSSSSSRPILDASIKRTGQAVSIRFDANEFASVNDALATKTMLRQTGKSVSN